MTYDIYAINSYGLVMDTQNKFCTIENSISDNFFYPTIKNKFCLFGKSENFMIDLGN